LRWFITRLVIPIDSTQSNPQIGGNSQTLNAARFPNARGNPYKSNGKFIHIGELFLGVH
jgi:hypothetical protein